MNIFAERTHSSGTPSPPLTADGEGRRLAESRDRRAHRNKIKQNFYYIHLKCMLIAHTIRYTVFRVPHSRNRRHFIHGQIHRTQQFCLFNSFSTPSGYFHTGPPHRSSTSSHRAQLTAGNKK